MGKVDQPYIRAYDRITFFINKMSILSGLSTKIVFHASRLAFELTEADHIGLSGQHKHLDLAIGRTSRLAFGVITGQRPWNGYRHDERGYNNSRCNFHNNISNQYHPIV